MSSNNFFYKGNKGEESVTKEPIQKLIVQPKLRWFFIVYLLTSLPGIIISILAIILLITLIGASAEGFKKNTDVNAYSIADQLVKSKDGDVNKKILIYKLDGEILSQSESATAAGTNIYVDQVKKDFESIKKDDSIKNVVFDFNSPGGEVFASENLGDEFNSLLRAKGQETGIFYYDQIAASGVLFATNKVSKNYIVASPYGQTGSIGVRTSLPNYQKLADNIGYKETVIKAGSNKDVGNPLRDATPEELAYFQKSVDKSYEEFTTLVATGRNQDITKIKAIANGFVYSNDEAKGLGLVDELGPLDNAVNKAADTAKISNFSVYHLEPKQSLIQQLLGSTNMLSFLGLTKLNSAISKASDLKPGVQYMIDESRI